jgi:FKBP-type peptidyl-prolyl cis-trans isomerase FklB
MKKLSFFFAAIMLVLSVSFASCSKTSEKKMKTAIDSLSYAYGVGMGYSLAENLKKEIPGDMNIDLFLDVFEAALKGDTGRLAISQEEAYAVFQQSMAAVQLQAAEKNKKDAASFMEKNGKKAGVVTTPSGLQYEIIKDATGPKPTDTSTVKCNYHGTLLDGEVFDSSVDRKEPVEFVLNQVIPGWQEGIKFMSVGSKYKFWIPSTLAYGDQGVPGVIEPGEMLIFEVELLGLGASAAN